MTYVIWSLPVLVFLGIWSFFIEPYWLKIRRIPIRLKNPLKEPLTILHLSDTHFPLRLKKLNRFFGYLASLKPDLVVLTGDMIESDAGIAACAQAVSKLRSRLGTYAVFGNHDHYEYTFREVLDFIFGDKLLPKKKNDTLKLKEMLEHAGCKVLMNEAIKLEKDGQKFCLIGMDDPVTRQARPDAAFQSVNGADVRILLSHSVHVLRKLKGQRIDLALGGHTHGGQVMIPLFGPFPLKTHSPMGRKYMAGLHRYGETITYTSRGLGEGKFFPIRFHCRPEVILFEIK